MLRFWLKPALILLLGLALAALTARALGSTQPPHPALAGFTKGCENLPQPCWYGVIPGETTLVDAQEQLVRVGYFMNAPCDTCFTSEVGFASSDPTAPWIMVHLTGLDLEPRVNLITFYAPDDTIGDVMALWGSPTAIGELLFFGSYLGYVMEDGVPKIRVFAPGKERWSAHIDIGYIELNGGIFPERQVNRWHGFISWWRYCQLEPATYGC